MLSAAATFGLISVDPLIEPKIRRILKVENIKHMKKVCDYFVSVFSCSISATIITLPFSAFYFGKISLIAPIANVFLMFPFTVIFLLAVITVLVIFFSYAFLRQYISFWYPSALVYSKNHFKIAKKISDDNFWSLLSRLIVFDIVIFVFDLIYVIANFSIANAHIASSVTTNILLFINIIFKTVFIALLVCFIFTSFHRCNEKYMYRKDKV
jgi:hypothetical protein